jgi:regulator of sigma D
MVLNSCEFWLKSRKQFVLNFLALVAILCSKAEHGGDVHN